MHGYQVGLFITLFQVLLVTLVSSTVLGGTMIMHNGKPFFPIGIYHYPKGLPLEPRLEELSRAGFNTVLSGLTSSIEFMDKAHEFGIGVLPTLGWNMILDPGGEETKKAYLREHIERLKDHPALLGYEAPDEIAWVDFESLKKPGQNLEALLKGYEFIKSIDPVNPIWMNHAPRNNVEYLKSYSEAGDILGTDIYPVPDGNRHSDLDQSLNCVGQYTEKLDRVGEGRPIYMVLQGFSWDDLPPIGSRDSPQPNWIETRFMAYDAVLHGANGIIYWGMAYTEIGDAIWEHLKRIASELRDITPVILDSTRMPMELDSGLEIHHWQHRGYKYLFVLNTQRSSKKDASVKLPEDWSGEVASVLFEGRSLDVTGGNLVDSFQGLDVHIYTDDPRPDISIGVGNPVLLEKDEKAQLRVDLMNSGRSPTPPFNLTLTTDGKIVSQARIAGLDGTSTRSVDIEWTPMIRGEFVLHLEADQDKSIDERTNYNNRATFSLTVSPAGPDLQVTSVSMTGQESICVMVENAGLTASPSMGVSCTIGSRTLPDIVLPPLSPGGSHPACWDLVDPPHGAVSATFTADPTGDVEEMLEDNNQLAETLYLEKLVAAGPAQHVPGIGEGILLIKYDPSLGTLSGGEQVSLVWGVDGWIYPEVLPRETVRIGNRAVTPMSMGLDGLWYIVLPQQHTLSIEFEFEDSTGVDDNRGRGWKIVRASWVQGLLGEYERVVTGAVYNGVEMSGHSANLSRAWDLFDEGNYTAVLPITEGTEPAGVAYAASLLERALGDLETARSMGIDVSAHERSLGIAQLIIEAGKYVGAERQCLLTMEKLSDEMAKIPEFTTILMSLLALGWGACRQYGGM